MMTSVCGLVRAVADCAVPDGSPIYPNELIPPLPGHPTADRFEVRGSGDGRGAGLVALAAYRRGSLMARFSGVIRHGIALHTLQISDRVHLYDPWFLGMLLHSCSPNVQLDMQAFEMWAARDIAAGEWLTMDYASTEDRLFRQFPCQCGAAACRGWITGRKEVPRR